LDVLLNPPKEVIIVGIIYVVALIIYMIAVVRAGGSDYLEQDIRAWFVRRRDAWKPSTYSEVTDPAADPSDMNSVQQDSLETPQQTSDSSPTIH
jgi:hypothetical protein